MADGALGVVRHRARVGWVLGVARLRADLQYPVSALLLAVMAVTLTAAELAQVAFLLRAVPRLGGFTFGEVVLLYAIATAGFQLCNATFGSLDSLGIRIREGTFDQLLVRPVGTVVQLMAEGVSTRAAGRIVYCAAILVVAGRMSPVTWTAGRVAEAAVATVCGGLLFGGIFLGTSSIAFWVVDGRELASSVTYGGGFVSCYPLTAFEGWFRTTFFYVLPLVFVAWLPVLHILDKPDPLGLPTWLRFCSPVAAAATLALGALAWRSGIRHHRSTGT